MGKVRVGLALGSGAARGLAHIGVIKALEENGIGIDVVSGASIGAVVGGLYAAGLSIRGLAEFAQKFGRRSIAFWIDPSVFRSGGLLKGDKIEQSLRELVGPVSFSGCRIPFYAVATDLATGTEVVMSEGDIFAAIRASFAIPGIFSPVKIGKRWLVDGALSDPIPTKILQEIKTGLIIGVNVCMVSQGESIAEPDDTPRIYDVLMQVLAVAQQKLAEPCMHRANICIVPDVGGYSWTDFSKADQLIAAGYDSAMRMMTSIKKAISLRSKFPIVGRFFGSTRD